MSDLRQALRRIRQAPFFSLVVILTLAIGIGANTALFSVVRGVFLRPLPYGNADRLVTVWNDNVGRGWLQFGTSLPDFLDWRDRAKQLDHLSTFWSGLGNLTGSDRPERVRYATVSANLFETLGTAPALGRGFHAGGRTGRPGRGGRGERRLLAAGDGRRARRGRTHGAARRPGHGGSRRHAPRIRLSQHQRGPVEAARPRCPGTAEPRGPVARLVVGTIAPGHTRSEAAAEMGLIAGRLTAAYPATNTGWTVSLEPFRATLAGPSQAGDSHRLGRRRAGPSHRRGQRRQPAPGPRPLDANPNWRSARPSAPGTAGWSASWSPRAWCSRGSGRSSASPSPGWCCAGWHSWLPSGFAGGSVASLDGWVLLYSAGIVVLTGLVFAALPAVRAARLGIASAMRAGARGRWVRGRIACAIHWS